MTPDEIAELDRMRAAVEALGDQVARLAEELIVARAERDAALRHLSPPLDGSSCGGGCCRKEPPASTPCVRVGCEHAQSRHRHGSDLAYCLDCGCHKYLDPPPDDDTNGARLVKGDG